MILIDGNPPRMLSRGRLRSGQMGHGIERICVSTPFTRTSGMRACLYLVGDILIDTGMSLVSDLVTGHLRDRRISAIACTHHHEDHTGNAAVLSSGHRCPVYLHNAHAHETEGVVHMLPYRRWYWGEVPPYEPEEAPEPIRSGGRTLVPIPIPGHSLTHVAYHEPETGVVFTGDLYVSGGATAIMSHENPYESIRSLRRVAGLEPALMLTGHGLAMESPATRLLEKANLIEQAARKIQKLHRLGHGTGAIVRRLFHSGRGKELLMASLTQGEFSRANLVRACIRHAPGG